MIERIELQVLLDVSVWKTRCRENSKSIIISDSCFNFEIECFFPLALAFSDSGALAASATTATTTSPIGLLFPPAARKVTWTESERDARDNIRRALGSLVRDNGVSRTEFVGFDARDVNAVAMYVTVAKCRRISRIDIT